MALPPVAANLQGNPFASTPQQMAATQQQLLAGGPVTSPIAGTPQVMPAGPQVPPAGPGLAQAIRTPGTGANRRIGELLQMDLDRQRAEGTPFPGQAGNVPLTGLTGATEAINTATTGSISALEDLLGQARGEIAAGRERALEPIQGFSGGQEAQQQQAALSGALGPEAQAAAIAAFQASPQQAFLQEQGERAITRNAAALGGLGGGEVRRELARFGTGLAAQDFANQFQRLGDVANRGFEATRLGTGVETAATEGTAGLLAGQGRDVANILGGAGGQLAGLRSQAGRDLAQAISGTTQGLAQLSDQQGQALTGIFGEGAANVANLFNLAGQGDAQAQQQLAAILTNLGQDEAGLLASLFGGQAEARFGGDIAGAGVLRDTIGSVLEALPTPAPKTGGP